MAAGAMWHKNSGYDWQPKIFQPFGYTYLGYFLNLGKYLDVYG
jgi:hypothetical protein